MPEVGRKAIADIVSNPAIRLMSIDDALVDLAGRDAASLLLRGSDAVYVALAERLSVPLITWDNEQIVRAKNLIDVRMPTT
jgi:predicted nucleic acid-binding protein